MDGRDFIEKSKKWCCRKLQIDRLTEGSNIAYESALKRFSWGFTRLACHC